MLATLWVRYKQINLAFEQKHDRVAGLTRGDDLSLLFKELFFKMVVDFIKELIFIRIAVALEVLYLLEHAQLLHLPRICIVKALLLHLLVDFWEAIAHVYAG